MINFTVPRSETCYQIALAIKDEVEDLEKAGINIIQIDEAALREGLPLRKSEHAHYLHWAVHSFRITNVGVQDTTQVYSPAYSAISPQMCMCLSFCFQVLHGVSYFQHLADPHSHVLLQLQRHHPLNH